MPLVDTSVREGIPGPRIKTARGDYDFAVDGGVQGTIALMGATKIPLGAIIIGGLIKVNTAVLSAGSATVAVEVESAGDIVPTVGKASWTTGRKKVIPGLTSANDLSASAVIETTAARDISIVIATADLTAGKFSVVLFYISPLAA